DDFGRSSHRGLEPELAFRGAPCGHPLRGPWSRRFADERRAIERSGRAEDLRPFREDRSAHCDERAMKYPRLAEARETLFTGRLPLSSRNEKHGLEAWTERLKTPRARQPETNWTLTGIWMRSTHASIFSARIARRRSVSLRAKRLRIGRICTTWEPWRSTIISPRRWKFSCGKNQELQRWNWR